MVDNIFLAIDYKKEKKVTDVMNDMAQKNCE